MDGLKQRIVGALVLVSLAVIFVPMIFDEPHSGRTSTSVRIPEEPPFPEVNTPEKNYPEPPAYRMEEPSASSPGSKSGVAGPTGSGGGAQEDQSPPSASPEQSTAAPVQAEAGTGKATVTSEEPAARAGNSQVTNEKGRAEYTGTLEGAWVVQLGSFGNADNARRLRDKVREMGHSSHLQEVVRGDSTLTRVFSGPYVDKAEAEKAKQTLDAAFSINSLVTSGEG
ncbi:MAG TPA: sporulation protein [Marinobacter sp.]|nr:sporulation protein [Marinobacter sp.]